MRLLAAACVLALALAVPAAHAEEPLSAQELAKVTREMAKAADAVAKKYGNKKDLSPDDLREMLNEQAAAQKAVLERNNLDAKDVARATAKNGKAVDAEAKVLEAKEKEAEAAKKTTAAPATAPAAGATDSDANEAAAMDKARGIGKAKK
jgi:hypothetical protein